MNAAEMETLARKVWGAPNEALSSKDEMRFGKQGSKSIDLTKLTWFDHEAHEGGGFIELAKRAGVPLGEDSAFSKIYSYHSRDGRLAYQVCRKMPKGFLQRRPDGPDKWQWNMKGIEPLPYRLPQLLASAASAPVFIVEGEKDADALAERLLIATTNSGGAGNWRPSLNQYFKGRRVVILPDNDDAGHSHAWAVATALRDVAASVTILDLVSDMPPKSDISDWFAAGGTADELERHALEQLTAQERRHPPRAQSGEDQSAQAASNDSLADFLSVATWAARELPEPDRLLGDLVTSDSRVFLVGTTGLGKTMFGFALGLGMAAGAGFLHWRSARPCRVLYIDGEMSSALVKARSLGELRRVNAALGGAMTIYARDFDEQTEAAFPTLGKMPPLNTEEGHTFVKTLIDQTGGANVVIFDNVMSLLSGNMREDESWTNVQPLIAWLSAKRIAQVWFDHTGHDKTRQYGSSTKAWRFDAVGVMTALPDGDRGPGDLAFQLSFEGPYGKARRRTPDNASDFAPTTIRLIEDRWTSEQMKSGRATTGKVSPTALALHRALLDALAITTTPGETTRDAWHAEGVRLGLLEPCTDSDTRAERNRKRTKLGKYMAELKVAGWIGVDGEAVRDMKSHP